MKKEKKKKAFFNKYMGILDKIEDDQFDNDSVCEAMRRRYKKAKLDNNATRLWRKYESDLTELRNFAKKLPGVGSLSELPSGSNQLRHIKMPNVQKLLIEKHPVSLVASSVFCQSHAVQLAHDVAAILPIFVVQASIGDTWWLTSLSCKYMLCCFVHKDCKDLNTRPTELPAGHTRKEARANSRAVLAKEREESKAERIVGGERYDVEHQLKKARVVGIQAQAEKISIETIQTKLKLLRENADVYKSMHGEGLYNKMVVDLINKMTGSTTSQDANVDLKLLIVAIIPIYCLSETINVLFFLFLSIFNKLIIFSAS
jgi:hypothetical protein